jgi:hydroxyacylglutathione hydrolase
MLEINIIDALSDNYIYLIRNESKNITSVIDPGESAPVINFLNNRGWHLDEIVNTHHHHDHIGGNAKLLEIYKSKLIAPVYDKSRISHIDELVSDNDLINIAGTKTRVIHTPGHTLGHVCFYMADEKCLFSGDTIFFLGCGRVFEGTMDQMWASLIRLRILPDDTLVYCGHEYTLSNAKFAIHIDPHNQLLRETCTEIKNKRAKDIPTIPFELGREKIINPFLRADDQTFIDAMGLKTHNPSESFKTIRLQKDNF